MRRILRIVLRSLAVFVAGATPLTASARTFVIPHILETSGSSTTPYSFDTFFDLSYVPGLVDLNPAPGATVDVYVFDSSGAILESASMTPVCNPCSFGLSASQRRTVVSLQNQIVAAGGFGIAVANGFALLEVTGDADHVVVGASSVNYHSSATDFDLVVYNVPEVPGGLSASERLIVFPRFTELSTSTADPYAIDTSFHAIYAGGITGSSIPAGTGATVSLFLFANDGTPVQSATATNVCAPCSEFIDTADPTASFSLQSAFTNAGGFASSVATGFAMAVITGSADAVALQGLTANSHTSALDLSVAELESEELPYSRPPTSARTVEPSRALRSAPNPFQPSTRIDYAVGRVGRVTIEIVDVSGRIVSRPLDAVQRPGTYSITWNGRGDSGARLPSGVYFARLVTAEGSQVIKLSYLRPQP